MPNITLKPITNDNWRKAVNLKLKPGQENFIAPNWYTILQGMFERHKTFAAYDGETMIGLTMYGYVDETEGDVVMKGHEIIRLMIDHEHQNKGYGRAILNYVIAELKADPACDTIIIMFEPENEIARHLYTSIGFTDTGKIAFGECIFTMPGK